MSDDYRDDRNDELEEYSNQTTFQLEEDYPKEEDYTYRRRTEYDNGYYENRYQKYKNSYDYETKTKKSRGRGATVALALVFSLIGALLGGAVGSKLAYDRYKIDYAKVASTPPSYTINAKDEMTTVSAVAATNLDSVVGITTTTVMRDMFNRQVGAQAMGSGFVVNEEGYIMTNDHVIASLTSNTGYSSGGGYADQVAVVLNDGTQLPAEILWSDSSLDLAILKVKSDVPLKPVKLGDSDSLIIGEQAIAIGNPFALEFHGTVTAGYISGLDRTVSGKGAEMRNLIQTDASINKGNSGGPLLNAKGEVIGINTLKLSSGEGLGFSIPINTAKKIIEQVIETGTYEKVTIGVTGTDLEAYEKYFNIDLTPNNGIVVLEVLPDSPASKVGLQVNDVITKVNGEEIVDFKDLQNKISSFSFGDTITLEYFRNGQSQKVDITFESYNKGRS